MKENEFLIDLQLEFADSLLGRINALEQFILSLEKLQEEEKIHQNVRYLLSEFHSIKGSSGALQFKIIQFICHQVEDVILGQAESELKKQVDGLLKFTDMISDYVRLFKIDRKVDQDLFIARHGLQYQEIIPVVKSKPQAKAPIEQIIPLKMIAVGLSLTIINNLKKAAKLYDVNVAFTNSSSDALARLAIEDFDVVLSSFVTDPIDGLSFCMAVKSHWRNKNIQFILFPSEEIHRDLLKVTHFLLPDKIILKNQNMYQEFVAFLDKKYRSIKSPSDKAKESLAIKKIAFIDDESSLLELYQAMVDGRTHCENLFFNPLKDDLKKLSIFSPDLVVSDVNMPGFDVLQMMDGAYIRSTSKKLKFVFLTADPNGPIPAQLLAKGALGVYDKANLVVSFLDHLEDCGVEVLY